MDYLQSLWRKITAPRAAKEEIARREYTTRAILTVTGLLLLVFSLPIIFGWLIGQFDLEAVVVMLLITGPFGVGLWLARRGRWRVAGYIPPTAFFCLAVYGTYMAGLVTTMVLFYVMAISLSALLQRGKAQWGVLVLSLGAYLAAGWLHGDRSVDVLAPIAITVSGALVGLTVLHWFASQQLREVLRERTAALEKAAQEIEEHRQTEKALRESQDHYRTLVDALPNSIAILKNGRYVFSNPAGARILGLDDPAKVVGLPVLETIAPRSRPLVLERLEHLASGQNNPPVEIELLRPDGTTILIESRSVPIRLQGEPVTLVIGQDVTERERAKEALEKAEREKSLILDSTFEMFAYYDTNLAIQWANKAAGESVGLNVEELIGRHCYQLWHGRDEPCQDCPVLEALETGEPQETEMMTPDGRVWFLRGYPVFDERGEISGLIEFGQEITARVRAEAALRESEERYRNIFETAAVSIWEEDFGAVKAAFDELKAQGVVDFERYLKDHPEFVERATRLVRVVDVNDATLRIFGAESKKQLLGSLDKVFLPETKEIFRKEILAIAEGQSIFRGETVNQTLQGERIDILLTMAIPAETEKLGNVLISIMDITARKRVEEQLQASLREKEVLLQEIHHRVKNNLQIVSSLLDLQSGAVQDPRLFEVFQDSQSRIRSMALVHEKLYQSHGLASIDMAEYIHSEVEYLCRMYGDQGCDIQVRVDDVFLDIDTATPCGLVINELVSNALKHAFPADREGEAPEICVGLYAEADDQLILQVGDNGVGMPPDLDWQSASSLGLRLVNLLTRQLEGTIELERQGGTTFRIRFARPALEHEATA